MGVALYLFNNIVNYYTSNILSSVSQFHFLHDHIRITIRTVDFLEGKGYMQSYSVIRKKLSELEKKIIM